MSLTRRNFIKTSAIVSGAALFSNSPFEGNTIGKNPGKTITITDVDSNFEREPLIRPFGFKGGYMHEIWQTAAQLKSGSGIKKTGICTQSILWSDSEVFASHSESGGNALMYAMTEYGLSLLKGRTFTDPVALLDEIWPQVYDFGKKICRKDNLRLTFALNALVGVDNAVWLLYAAENGITNFDEMIPEAYKPALSHHNNRVAGIPLMAYSIPVDEIKSAVEKGYFFMKIKIGQPGTQTEMLEKDMARLTDVHNAIGNAKTPYAKNGKLPYYFDANGRYESKDTLLRLLDHAKKIGVFDQIAIIEEPFDEHLEIDISDIPVRIAADESAHTDKDALTRIQMGYKAIALKAIAKTLSMTMKIAQVAHEQQVPCFCADLTVNPILVEWNKNVAARLAPFPGIGLGLLETNGHQNYKNWETMKGYHPCKDATWVQAKDGVFELNDDFYAKSGGIFLPSPHYEEMFLK
ncbi:MAG: enolase C-terminal domain-like protein [Bacteroidota bacterium]